MGPVTTVQGVTESLLKSKSVFLFVPADLPWRRQMRDAVEAALRNNNDNFLVSYVDCQSDCNQYIDDDGNIDIFRFLCEEFGSSDSYNGYRKSSGLTKQKYIIQNNVLSNRIVWVKGMDRNQVETWNEFCSGYYPDRPTSGLFVIESYEEYTPQLSTCITPIQYHATYYDALLYNNIVASSMELKHEWIQYCATLSTQFCCEDVELSTAFIETFNYEEDEPIQSLTEIAQSPRFSNRYAASNLRRNHPFVAIRDGNSHALEKEVWEAQVRTLFPLIELERTRIIKSLYQQIKTVLNNEIIVQYREKICDPNDVELGTLDWLIKDGKVNVTSVQKKNRIALLHECRNIIAHMDCCKPKQVSAILCSDIEW